MASLTLDLPPFAPLGGIVEYVDANCRLGYVLDSGTTGDSYGYPTWHSKRDMDLGQDRPKDTKANERWSIDAMTTHRRGKRRRMMGVRYEGEMDSRSAVPRISRDKRGHVGATPTLVTMTWVWTGSVGGWRSIDHS
jgi:hypothetical protein